MEPKIGMGITTQVGSDCYAGTIDRVSESGKTFWYFFDTHPKNKYKYRASFRCGEWRNSMGQPIALGVRRDYRDPSF